MLGELNQEQIEHLLRSAYIGRLGCYADRKVYVVPITYVYDGKYIYAHSKEGMKIQMMRKNPRVCLQVDITDNMANWRSAVVWGKYEELKTEELQHKAMKKITDRFQPLLTSSTLMPAHAHPPEVVEKDFRAVAFRIKVTEKTGRYEKPNGLFPV